MAVSLNSAGENTVVSDDTDNLFVKAWLPLSMTFWGNITTFANARVVRLFDTTNNESYDLQFRATGDLRVRTTTGAALTLDVPTGAVTGQWNFYGVRWRTASDRAVYIREGDGVEYTGTQTTTGTPTASNPEDYRMGNNTAFNADIAYWCVWNVALEDEHLRALAHGMHPLELAEKLGKGSLNFMQPLISGVNENSYGLRANITKSFTGTYPPVHPYSLYNEFLPATFAAVGSAIVKVVDEVVTINTGVLRLMTMVRLVDETVSIVENNLRLLTLVRIISESVIITTNAVRLVGIIKIINETITISENVVKTLTQSIVGAASLVFETFPRVRAVFETLPRVKVIFEMFSRASLDDPTQNG